MNAASSAHTVSRRSASSGGTVKVLINTTGLVSCCNCSMKRTRSSISASLMGIALLLSALVASLDPALAIGTQVLDQCLGHGQIVEPLVIGGCNIPGRIRADAGVDSRLVGGHIGVPELALLP